MMRIARSCPAHQAGLRRHKGEMRFAALAHRFGKGRDRRAIGFSW